ncbi:MAG: hypothetical protein II427_00670, partial [Firmicutes bacterium]|nr:hypothetical protein [Bacillota bacterium]
MKRCVIIGGAPIARYDRIQPLLQDDDFVIYCDSGLKHQEKLNRKPDLIIGDFDSHEKPDTDIETIVLPTVVGDDIIPVELADDTAFAEGDFHIPEPQNHPYTGDFDLIVVPG